MKKMAAPAQGTQTQRPVRRSVGPIEEERMEEYPLLMNMMLLTSMAEMRVVPRQGIEFTGK